ncbi:hypothetical protein JRO89_XS01G0277300 [Xanthoceras sorbifolium]|uniref:Uncharacterized protein n=1 Tax=Xanthoceras sorbifolium TaxID=99658 RepID=A0ABQ8ILR8_9ROSI|nr:hypothetical protein JRO89_XS01G0277300 [Xanthoceras sorbifolium]
MQEIFAFLILCFSYPSTILGREKVIVLNLEDIKAIIRDCSYLDARTRELEIDAYPALEELISKVRDELEQLLDDMEDLYLSRKIGNGFLLQAYHTQIDGTLNKLIMLDKHRNQLIQVCFRVY